MENLLKRLFAVLAIAILPLASCSESPQQDAAVDTYTITVNKETPRILTVQADLAYAGDVLSMEWASAQFLEAGWATFVENLEVVNSNGEKMEVEHILPAKWKLSGEATQRITLNYQIKLDHDITSWQEGGHSESSYVLGNLFFFIGRAVFITAEVLPEEFDGHNYKIVFNVPEEYKITSQWNDTEVQNTFVIDSTRELVNSGVLVGEQTIRNFKIDNTEIVIATANDFTDAIPVFESIYLGVAPYANRVMGNNPASKYVVIANIAPRSEKYGPYFSGGVLSRTISIISPIVPTPEMQGVMEYILTHEYLHIWNTHMQVEEEQLESWFTEGFTDYMAIRSLNALGKLPDNFLLNGERGILGNYQKYLAGRDPKVSLRNAGLTKNQGSYDHVYSGGFTFAAALDMELIKKTNGKVSLADYMSEVFGRFDGKGKIKFDDLVNIANELAGSELRPMYDKYVLGTEIVPIGDYLYGVGLEMVKDAPDQSQIEMREDIPEDVASLREQFMDPDGLIKHLPTDSAE